MALDTDDTTAARELRERRASARLPVEMWVEDLTDGGQVFRRAGNLSRGGLHLDFSIPIPIGSPVNLRFALPGHTDVIQVSGKVVSIDTSAEFGMGIAFSSVPPETQAKLDDFVVNYKTPPGGTPVTG